MGINTNAAPNLLGSVRDAVAAAATANVTSIAGQQRKQSDFWLNIGITLPGAGKDGTDLFVSLPNGLPLDDMKVVDIRGNNVDWIHLAQAKNALLETTQKAAGELAPGQTMAVPQFEVQLYRRAQPEQTAKAGENPLVDALARQLKGS